jgi:hypothetical protein
MRAAVVALGDLGRCAPMLYHAHALAANGVDVDLVGFEGTPLPQAVTANSRITIHRLNPATLRLRGGFPPSHAVAGLLTPRDQLPLWRTPRAAASEPRPRPEPAGVSDAVRHVDSAAPRCRQPVIDWRNPFTMLQVRLGRWHPAVRPAVRAPRRAARRRQPVRAPRASHRAAWRSRRVPHDARHRPSSRGARALPSGLALTPRRHAGSGSSCVRPVGPRTRTSIW